MKKLIVSLFILFLVIILYFNVTTNEYYIPKPESLVKIELPESRTSIFTDEKISFKYSNSSSLNLKDNFYSLNYPQYLSTISFKVTPLLDFDLEIYNFENSISVHERKGRYITLMLFKIHQKIFMEFYVIWRVIRCYILSVLHHG